MIVEAAWSAYSTLLQLTFTTITPFYLNHHSQPSLHTTSIITQASHYLNRHSRYLNHRTSPHYLNHHSQPVLHITSTITHSPYSTLLPPSLTSLPPNYLNHHSHTSSTLPQRSLTGLHTTSTITHNHHFTLTQPHTHNHHSQPSLISCITHAPHYLNHHS